MALAPCRECKQPVSTSAKTCPHCGTNNPARSKGMSAVFLLGLLILGGVFIFGGKTGISNPPETTPKQSLAVVTPSKHVDSAISPDQLAAFDAEEQAEAKRVSDKYLAELLPKGSIYTYYPDPQLTKKTIRYLQPVYDQLEIAYEASLCHLRDWESGTRGPFSNAYLAELKRLFPDGRDQGVAINHVSRVFNSSVLNYDRPPTSQECEQLAHSQTLRDLDAIMHTKP